MEEMATLRESMMRLWSEEGPWALTLGSKRVLMSLVRQQFFIKDVGPGEVVPVNCWGMYQAVRHGGQRPTWNQTPRGSGSSAFI
ncbi:Coiled-coil domain-containing protein 154 [Camelus dromedarius]|uniref:Coiled-coil domain-containing protein 154 n=1 Tax=Camelus dromedarius TaxID=9838 RepID=A0A5N4BZT2_CAMDR|nr:Coiled-coil domain-containing protein 154 [Camelus dromedarius]